MPPDAYAAQAAAPPPSHAQFPNDPYAQGYDAVNYPSIPALVEHSRGGSGGTFYSDSSYASMPPPSGGGGGGGGGGGRSPSYASGPRSRPAEVSGAPEGNARYRCMLLPTRDGGDIEDVIAQVGLDGLVIHRAASMAEMFRFPMERISRWSLTDATIVSVATVPGGGGGDASVDRVALSADAATVAAVVDTLTTSAFQWCELSGRDPAGTIEEKSASGRAEWVNNGAGGVGASSPGGGSGSDAAASRPLVAWHESQSHCGWLTKKGERLSTWRKRWFVLKDGKLAWFRSNADVVPGAKPRGVLNLADCVSACTASKAEAGRAHGLELIGSAEAEKAGCKFLVADSERECDAWAKAIAEAVERTASGTGAGGGAGGAGGAGEGAGERAGALAGRLRDGFADAGRRRSGFERGPSTVSVNVPGYDLSPAPAPAPPAPPSHASQWETFYTNEGTPYFVNAATGVTTWDQPPGVTVEM